MALKQLLASFLLIMSVSPGFVVAQDGIKRNPKEIRDEKDASNLGRLDRKRPSWALADLAGRGAKHGHPP